VKQLATVFLLALVATGCGAAPRDSSEDFKGDERAVAAVVEDLEATARDNDPDKVCSKLLTDSLLAAIKAQGTKCTTGIKEGFEDADSFDVKVEEVTISGRSATAKVVSGRGSTEKTDTMQLERDGTVWKIASLGA